MTVQNAIIQQHQPHYQILSIHFILLFITLRLVHELRGGRSHTRSDSFRLVQLCVVVPSGVVLLRRGLVHEILIQRGELLPRALPVGRIPSHTRRIPRAVAGDHRGTNLRHTANRSEMPNSPRGSHSGAEYGNGGGRCCRI